MSSNSCALTLLAALSAFYPASLAARQRKHANRSATSSIQKSGLGSHRSVNSCTHYGLARVARKTWQRWPERLYSLWPDEAGQHDENALKLARRQVQRVFVESPLFSPDNTFRHGGHMHGNLRTLAGAADYALYTGNPVLFSRVDALFRYVRSEATSFGFMPEVIGRQGDVVATETCALMDYIGLAVTLANHGHPEYCGDVERVVRNQLAESQATDLSWLQPAAGKADTDQFTWRDLAGRLVGGYAGWSSPTHFLAACETLHWGGPELRGKTRAFQNCCGGSGTHGFFIAWKNAASFKNGTLSVHLHFDKLLPQAEIRGYQPFEGRLTIRLKEDCAVRVRIPDFVEPGALKVEAGGSPVAVKVWGNYAELGRHSQDTTLKITFPLVSRTEEVHLSNPGFQRYRYRVLWRGDTVMAMEPLGNEYSTGYSDFEKKEVPVYYGKEGPGPLYQRAALFNTSEPQLTPLQTDDGKLNGAINIVPPAQSLGVGCRRPVGDSAREQSPMLAQPGGRRAVRASVIGGG